MKNPSTSRRARLAAAGLAALAVGVFASLGATGYAARLVGLSHTSPEAAQYPPSKVTICHHTHSQKNPFVTITVSEHALPAHLGHGDTVGACSAPAPSSPAHSAKPEKVHTAHQSKHANRGQAHGHGKPAKSTVKSHGKSNGAHGQANAPSTGPSTAHGQGKSHAKIHGQGKGHEKTHGQGQGHSPSHGPGNGQGQGQGQGHGPGNGQGQGGGRGNSGGGKGNGHKP